VKMNDKGIKHFFSEIKNFGNLSVEDFVSAVHKVTRGDLAKLNVDHKKVIQFMEIFPNSFVARTNYYTESG
jgi:hypothetical protein